MLCKETFPSDTNPSNLSKAFADIRSHSAFKDLKLRVAVYHIKNASRKPFLEETHADFMNSMETYVGGAMAFSQEVVKMLFAHHGEKALTDGGEKKGTLILTGTLGAMRTNTNFAAYGGSRSAARSLAQALAKEYSPVGIQVVHTIVNGSVIDEESEATRSGKKISAEALGRNYLWLSEQEPTLWTHELDMRPAQEKF
jgi:NAD(P)-dependent dehydrogenase (short-subunit alcohol dehydrogenase family)